jgi:hypothetical protein
MLLCAIVSLAFWQATAEPSFDLGAVVTMRDVSAGGNYEGTWTRRGNSNVYDAEWTFVPTGQKIVDVIEVRGVENGRLVIYRRGNQGIYSAPLKNGKLGRGTASWVSDPDYYWEVVAQAASQPAPKERWYVTKAKGGAFGYDLGTIAPGSKPGLKVGVYAVYNPKGWVVDGDTANYEVVEAEYNCAKAEFTILTVAKFDAAGEAVSVALPTEERGLWSPFAALSAAKLMGKVICERAILNDSREVGSLEAAFSGLKEAAGK